MEIDEFGASSEVGAGRIIDIGDERNPQVISNLRLEVHQPENFPAQANDNGAQNPVRATPATTATCRRASIPGSWPAA